MATPRQAGGRRAKKTRDARTGQFATITLILDRKANNIQWELMGLSSPEAYGIVVLAERAMSEAITSGDNMAVSGTSTADEWYPEDDEDD